MLNNLKTNYLREQDFGRVIRVIERLRQLDPFDPVQQRDLGITLLQSGQSGQAIDHLKGYLAAAPGAEDISTIRQFLDRARGEVAKWN